MSSRRKAREVILKILYISESRGINIDAAISEMSAIDKVIADMTDDSEIKHLKPFSLGLDEKQKEFVIPYKDIVLSRKLRCDLVVDGKVIVENKSIAEINPIDEVQLVSYLKASRLQVGLIFNFGQKSLQFKRRILTQK